jgi:multidrug efflux pump subunit AcrB
MQPDAHAVAARSLAVALRGCSDLELVDISGFEENIVEVRVDPARMTALQVDFSSVVSAVSGAIREGVRQRMQVDSEGYTIELAMRMGHWDADWKVKDVETLRIVPVQTQSGQTISLGNITVLNLRAGKAPATHMGQPALYLKIATRKDRGCLDEIIEKYRQSHPDVRLDRVPSEKRGQGSP